MRAGPLPFRLALVAVAGLNVAFGSAVAIGQIAPVTVVALLPALLVAAGALIASNRAILVFGAFAIDLSGIIALRKPVIGDSVYASDLILVLALGSWVAAWLIALGGRRPSWPRTPLLSWPLLVFAIFIGAGIVRGHERWGLSYFSQPLRFVLYAGIAAAIADLKPRQAWQGLVVVFYLGAVANAVAAAYYLATGTVQLANAPGGFAVLTLTTGLFLTGALVLALLNLEREQRAARMTLHLFVGALAVFGIVVSYGRGIWYAITAVIAVLFLTRPRLRKATLVVLPLCLPALVLGSLLLLQTAPGFVPGVVKRVTTIHNPSVEWREAANEAIWAQVRENPIVGVGFGKGASFSVDQTRFNITQDPHNSYLFLWAGGGILTLASFLLLYLIFLGDAWRRYRNQTELPRALIAWCLSIWFCFALNTLSAGQLTQSNSLLVLWILMLLPTIVPYARKDFGDALPRSRSAGLFDAHAGTR